MNVSNAATIQSGVDVASAAGAQVNVADGTYVDMTTEGEEVGGGTWTTRSDMVCFDPVGENEDQAERCWTNDPPREDGSFMTNRVDSDESYRVTPLEE